MAADRALGAHAGLGMYLGIPHALDMRLEQLLDLGDFVVRFFQGEVSRQGEVEIDMDAIAGVERSQVMNINPGSFPVLCDYIDYFPGQFWIVSIHQAFG